MAALPDTIPLRVRPLPGEALDSWLEAYARRLACRVIDILRAAGLSAAGPRPASSCTICLAPAELEALSALTAVPAGDLAATTLAGYDGTLVRLDPARRILRRGRWLGRTTGSRYCPRCLEDDTGRWQLSWRLPWSFACTRHQVMLAETCPACGTRPRVSWTSGIQSPPPGTCRSAVRSNGQAPVTCGYLLHDAPAVSLPPDGLVLRAQQRIASLISTALTRPGEPAAAAALTRSLDDIYVTGRAAITALRTPLTPPDAARQALAELGSTAAGLEQGQARYGQRRRDTRSIAFCAAVAVAMLRDGPAAPDPAITGWILDGMIYYTAQVDPGQGTLAVMRHWRRATTELQGAFLARLGPRLAVSQRLRYGTSTPSPRRPAPGAGHRRARYVPALLWPGWALRLAPAGLFESLPYRAALSMLLVHAATRGTSFADAWAKLGRRAPVHGSVGHVTRRLEQAGALDQVLSALCQLARKLDTYGAPVDYARRRALFTPAAFDDTAWKECCDLHGHRNLRGQRATARLYLTELLTGCHPRCLPPPLGLPCDAGYEYSRTVLALPAELVAHLHDQAWRLLDTAGITEPVRWEPPFGWVTGITWPGPQVTDAPAATIRDLMRAGHSHRAIARQLQTTIEHIRLAAATSHDAIPARTSDHPSKLKFPRTALPPPQQLRRYYEAGLGRRGIARFIGCGDSTAARLLRDAGLPLRPPGYRSAHLTAEWLQRHYTSEGLTIRQIADSAGLSPRHVAAIARSRGIRLRKGMAARGNPLTLLGSRADFPPGMWAAFQRFGGEQRIRRALVVMQHPTYKAAARAIGTGPTAICTQISTLETDLGIRLIDRGPGFGYNWATPDGRQFARRARHILDQLDQLRAAPPREAPALGQTERSFSHLEAVPPRSVQVQGPAGRPLASRPNRNWSSWPSCMRKS